MKKFYSFEIGDNVFLSSYDYAPVKIIGRRREKNKLLNRDLEIYLCECQDGRRNWIYSYNLVRQQENKFPLYEVGDVFKYYVFNKRQEMSMRIIKIISKYDFFEYLCELYSRKYSYTDCTRILIKEKYLMNKVSISNDSSAFFSYWVLDKECG